MDHKELEAAKPSGGNPLLVPGLLAVTVFSVLAIVRMFQLQKIWNAGKPDTDLLLPLFLLLMAAGLVLALWKSLKNAARRTPALGWVLRIPLVLLFAFTLYSAIRQYNIMNLGSWLFCGAAVLGIVGCLLWPLLRKHRVPRMLSTVFAVLYLLAGFVCLFLGLNMYLGTQGPSAPAGTPALVLGSQVNGTTPSADLQVRINTAAVWLKKNPSSKVVACGGKGKGESITEAECIRRGLTAKGIAANRILLDDKSVNTDENIKNAKKLLGSAKSVAIVTDDYHTCRARLLAEAVGLQAYPVPSKTPDSCRTVSVMREFLALPVQMLNLHS